MGVDFTGASASDADVRGDLENQLKRFSLLYDLTRALSELTDLDELVSYVTNRSKELLQAEGSAVLLHDEQRGELFFPYSADVAPDVEQRFAQIRFPADRGIAGWVLQHEEAQLVADVSRDGRFYNQVDVQSGMSTRSLLCAPLRTRRGTVGVIELRNKVNGTFTQDDLEFLCALANGIAVTIENARLYGRLKASEARLREEVAVLHRDLVSQSRFADIIGASSGMRKVFELMESAITTPVTVLLQGETGTGKELIARAIHYNGAREDHHFVAVNCGALPEQLLESELFGHRRGAFTGAVVEKKGLFEVADGGTIFLDEIAEMTPVMQVKLLRVLQSGEIRRVGDTEERHVDVRVIAATHRDLPAEVAVGRFREDLYYRCNTFPIHVPPLRERSEDIPLIASHLLKRTAERFSKQVPGFSPAALAALVRFPWPGNVRELENEIERAVALVEKGGLIQLEHLSERLTAKRGKLPIVADGTTLRRALEQFEREYIASVLMHAGGNATQAAKSLGVSRVTLQTKIAKYKLRSKLQGKRPT